MSASFTTSTENFIPSHYQKRKIEQKKWLLEAELAVLYVSQYAILLKQYFNQVFKVGLVLVTGIGL